MHWRKLSTKARWWGKEKLAKNMLAPAEMSPFFGLSWKILWELFHPELRYSGHQQSFYNWFWWYRKIWSESFFTSLAFFSCRPQAENASKFSQIPRDQINKERKAWFLEEDFLLFLSSFPLMKTVFIPSRFSPRNPLKAKNVIDLSWRKDEVYFKIMIWVTLFGTTGNFAIYPSLYKVQKTSRSFNRRMPSLSSLETTDWTLSSTMSVRRFSNFLDSPLR